MLSAEVFPSCSALIFYVATLIYITGEQIKDVKRVGVGGKRSEEVASERVKEVIITPSTTPATANKVMPASEDKRGMCRGVTGSEEGYWTEDGTGYRYNVKGCKLKRYDRDSARKCLQNR